MGISLFSIDFLIIYVAIFFAYYTLARRFQWQLLLVFSLVFYFFANRWEYAFLLAGVIGINYFFGILIQEANNKTAGRLYLVLCIIFNSALLIFFKHPFFLKTAMHSAGSKASIVGGVLVAPLGISYFTFKLISYALDIYRNKIRGERNVGKFALYISFFAEISSGPIHRAKEFLPQATVSKDFVYTDVISGGKLILWGLFKKVVIANNLARYVNLVYDSPRDYSAVSLLVATYFLSFQLYTDFSGYTDIVRGASRLLGYNLPNNFNTPYLAISISEFWKRWHITLSTWLRDYLFLPLAYFFSRRIKTSRLLLFNSDILIYSSSILITFFIAGVWHGSAWTFILWGLLHGTYLSFSIITRSLRKKLRRKYSIYRLHPKAASVIQTLFCFHLVTLSWIFFRASSVKNACYIIKHSLLIPLNMHIILGDLFNPFEHLNIGETKYNFVISALAMILLVIVEARNKDRDVPSFLESRSQSFRWLSYYLLILAIFLFGEFGLKEFIYVQF